jgi:predicted transcriptional regulator
MVWGMNDLENFLTPEECISLANARKQSDICFDEIDSLEDELEQCRQEHLRHTNAVDALFRAATQRKEKYLAEVEAGLADLAGGAVQ